MRRYFAIHTNVLKNNLPRQVARAGFYAECLFWRNYLRRITFFNLQPLADRHQLGADVLEFLDGLHAPVHAAVALREALPGTLQRESLVLQEELHLLKGLDILRMIQPVPLGVALGMDELLEIVAPVAHGRGMKAAPGVGANGGPA